VSGLFGREVFVFLVLDRSLGMGYGVLRMYHSSSSRAARRMAALVRCCSVPAPVIFRNSRNHFERSKARGRTFCTKLDRLS
jgi:hypothetical protein